MADFMWSRAAATRVPRVGSHQTRGDKRARCEHIVKKVAHGTWVYLSLVLSATPFIHTSTSLAITTMHNHEDASKNWSLFSSSEDVVLCKSNLFLRLTDELQLFGGYACPPSGYAGAVGGLCEVRGPHRLVPAESTDIAEATKREDDCVEGGVAHRSIAARE